MEREKRRMRRETRIKRSMMFAFMFALMIVLGGSVSAASKNQRALAAYKKILSKGTYSYKEKGWNYRWKLNKFAIIDINKDGVKEMIAGESVYGPALIFAYNGKRAVRLCTEYTHQSLVKFTYNPKQKALYFPRSANASYVEHHFVKVTSKGKLQRTILIMDWEDGRYYWTKNGKQISKKTWQKLDANLRGSKQKSIRFYSNTSGNRKKIGKLNSVA